MQILLTDESCPGKEKKKEKRGHFYGEY